MLYPATPLIRNAYIHKFLELFHTFLPAFSADIVMRVMGEKPIMFKIQKKFRAAIEAGNVYTIL